MDIPLPASWAEARGQILPVLRRISDPPNAARAARTAPENELLSRPFAPLLAQRLVLDLPDLRLYLNRGHLAAWGINEDVAFGMAIENLRYGAAQGLGLEPQWGLWQLASGDGYDSSRLLLPTWLDAFRDQVDGDPIAIVPAARILLVGGSENHGQLAALVDVADRAFRGAGAPLSPMLYTTDKDANPVPFLLPKDHILADRVNGARRLLEAYEYAEQRDDISEDPEVAGVFARISMHRKPDTGRAWTVATWTQTDDLTWLPQADNVQFGEGDDAFTLPWEVVAQQVHLGGGAFDPIRFPVSWPTPSTLAELRGMAPD
ncbi:MAG: hypothetical protein GWP91_15680 [Rhodobacterales bacterium]|nr:hypothetical protein [Rhodobacterales bacterium]